MDNNIERYNLLIKDKGTHGQPALNIHRNFGKSQNQLHNNPPTSIFNFKRTNCRNQRNRVIWAAHSFEDLRRLWTDRRLKYRFLKPGKIKSAFYIIQHLGGSVPIQAVSSFVSDKPSNSVHGPLCAWISPSALCSSISLPSHLWHKLLRALCTTSGNFQKIIKKFN